MITDAELRTTEGTGNGLPLSETLTEQDCKYSIYGLCGNFTAKLQVVTKPSFGSIMHCRMRGINIREADRAQIL